jgi:hypothetical protein
MSEPSIVGTALNRITLLHLSLLSSSVRFQSQHLALYTQEASQAACCPAGPPPAPGEPVSLQQKLINTATSALQTFHPLN